MGVPFSRELRARFCARSLDRLSNIEANWWIASQGAGDVAASEAMLREIHTMKGDADMLGFVDLRKLCAAAEKMVVAATRRGFHVGEDLNLLVSMAVQFMSMLLQSPETKLSGIDVDGFVAQVDEILARLELKPACDPLSPSHLGAAPARALQDERLAPETLERLAVAATTAFVEMLHSSGESRRRLGALWELLRGEVGRLHQTGLAEELGPHVSAAEALAERQGKRVRVVARLGAARVARRALDAVNTAAVHLLRNAVDHGLESPEARVATGKPPVGTITLSATEDERFLSLTIDDDGVGVELEAVRRAATARGLCAGEEPRPNGELLELLFEHGFTTRREVSDVSGRGVGLDAVKRAVEGVGGAVRLESRGGGGTRVTLAIPTAAGGLSVNRFAVAGSPIDFAVSADWQVDHRPFEAADRAIDPLDAVSVRRDWARAEEAPSHVISCRRDDTAVELLAASPPTLVRAHRPCPTGAVHAAEVIDVEGVDVLLIRPERVHESRDRAGAGRNPIAMGRAAQSLILRCDLSRRGEVTVATGVLASPTRLFVSTDLVLRRGDTVELALSFPGLLEPVACVGEVASRHVQSNPGEPRGLLLSLELGAGARRLLAALESPEPTRPAAWSVLVAARVEALRVSFPAVLSRMRGGEADDGLVVQTAADADGVLQLTRDGEYDLVILDADLDDAEGGALVRPLRGARPQIGVVVLGPDVAARRGAMVRAGVDLYLAKPVAARQLLDTMRRLLFARSGEVTR